ncbi:D-alanyl-D-alanine carboxypeptidase [Glaciihabitans arcticus]|uniref:D-alanyl-D-alanine carboxypeptidase n=1 Tax=Glaciihabitans arcticus TaxID=2668039 RepID=A0A4Q9GVI5_9MICO|nr:D-alanyl-D-alanine carboxypeptidase [Glaciihabitans arcticus]TBN56663.1 D-alanyl-D-alanine carboxypeptidase [Glaciihabitans arcticus]
MPLSRRQILRRRRITVFGGLAALLVGTIYLPLTLLAPVSPVAAEVAPYTSPTQAASELPFPDYGATGVGAIGFPGTLATSGNSKPVSIASITKVITVLVVLEKKPLKLGDAGPNITTTSADVALWNKQVAQNGSVAPVRSGISLTEREVIDLILVKSANNYAETLVNWAFGSEAAYLVVAREWLSTHRLTSTTLADSTGFAPGNRSTTTDLVELGKLALSHPLLSSIVGTKTESISHIGPIKNTNELLGVDGVRGIKTGTTDDAGACLLFAADYTIGGQTVTVVGVMLGGKTHPRLNESIRALLGGVVKSFHEVPLVGKGDSFASYSTAWGDTTDLVATEDSSVLVWADTPITLLVQTEKLGVAAAGSDAGELIFAVGNTRITVPLETKKALEDPGAWWRLTHPAELF